MDQFLQGLTGWQAIAAMAIVGGFAGIRMWLGVKGDLRKDDEQAVVGGGYQELIDRLEEEVERLKADIIQLLAENKQLRQLTTEQQAEIDRLKLKIERLSDD